MLELRPIIVDENFIVQGGNMRLKALQELKFKDIPDEWVKQVSDLTEEQKKEFIIKDNVGFGEWDFDDLANNWDVEKLNEWGLDIPNFINEPSLDELIGEEKNKPATLKITFENVEQLQSAEIDIKELIDRKYKGAYYSLSAGEI
jgi:ParB-like chromosome segregation protein Spo0J